MVKSHAKVFVVVAPNQPPHLTAPGRALARAAREQRDD
jgi:hypothetical protein